MQDFDIIAPGAKPGTTTTEKRVLAAIDAILRSSGMPPDVQGAVALNAAILAATRLPGTVDNRGDTINALTKEFRDRLQKYLPRRA